MDKIGRSSDRWFYYTFFVFSFLVIGFQLVLHFAPRLVESRSRGFGVDDWTYCVSSVASSCQPKKSIRFPGAIPERVGKGSLVVLSSQFEWPAWCNELNPCGLIIGTISDPAEIYLNDLKIGEVGSPRSNPKYSQTYPLKLRISSREVRSGDNHIKVILYPSYQHVHGLIRGPVRVAPLETTTVISSLIISHTVALPFFSGLMLLIIAIGVILLAIRTRESGAPLVRWFLAYAVVMALYAFSLTRIPREFLDPTTGVSLHFTLRTITEFLHLNLIMVLFGRRHRWLRGLSFAHLGIGIGIFSSLIIGYFQPSIGAEISDFFRLLFRRSVLLYAVSPVIAVVWSIRDLGIDSRKGVFAPAYVLTSAMVVSDFLALNGYIEDIYFVRSYPLIVALTYAYYLWDMTSASRRLAAVNEEIGKISTQVAHDLKSPLGALGIVASKASGLDDKAKSVLEMSVKRIGEISEDLLCRVKGVSTQTDGREELAKISSNDLCSVLEVIRAELSPQLPPLVKMSLEDPATQFRIVRLSIGISELSRVIVNLVGNSVEALAGEGSIQVKCDLVESYLRFSVTDNGCGISPEEVQTVLRAGHSKSGSTGLGLQYVKETIEAAGGAIEINSSIGQGTTVTFSVPVS